MAIVGHGIAAMSAQNASQPFSAIAKPCERFSNCSTNLRSTPAEKDLSPAPRSTTAPTSLRRLRSAAAPARPSATPASIAFMRAALSKVTIATRPRISVATVPMSGAGDFHRVHEIEAQAVEPGRVLEVDAVAGVRDHAQARVRE